MRKYNQQGAANSVSTYIQNTASLIIIIVGICTISIIIALRKSTNDGKVGYGKYQRYFISILFIISVVLTKVFSLYVYRSITSYKPTIISYGTNQQSITISSNSQITKSYGIMILTPLSILMTLAISGSQQYTLSFSNYNLCSCLFESKGLSYLSLEALKICIALQACIDPSLTILPLWSFLYIAACLLIFISSVAFKTFYKGSRYIIGCCYFLYSLFIIRGIVFYYLHYVISITGTLLAAILMVIISFATNSYNKLNKAEKS
jgi:hypothetical protein